MSRKTIFTLLAVVAIGAMALSSCSDDDDAATGDGSEDGGSSDVGNACPADGCTVSIASVEADENGELVVEFDANFAP